MIGISTSSTNRSNARWYDVQSWSYQLHVSTLKSHNSPHRIVCKKAQIMHQKNFNFGPEKYKLCAIHVSYLFKILKITFKMIIWKFIRNAMEFDESFKKTPNLKNNEQIIHILLNYAENMWSHNRIILKGPIRYICDLY